MGKDIVDQAARDGRAGGRHLCLRISSAVSSPSTIRPMAAQSFTDPDHGTGQGSRSAWQATASTPCRSAHQPVPRPSRPGHRRRPDAAGLRLRGRGDFRSTDAEGNVIDAGDVIFARSTDYGQTWQTTFQIGGTPRQRPQRRQRRPAATGAEDDVASGQALPRLAVDAQGNVAVIWYDTRRDPADHLLDVFGTVSTDGGQTFSPNFRVTDQSFDADQGSSPTPRADRLLPGRLPRPGRGQRHGLCRLDRYPQRQPGRLLHAHSRSTRPRAPNDRFEPNDTPDGDRPGHGDRATTCPSWPSCLGTNDWFRDQGRLDREPDGHRDAVRLPRLGLQLELLGCHRGDLCLRARSAVSGPGWPATGLCGPLGGRVISSTSIRRPVRQQPPRRRSHRSTPWTSPSLTADLGNVVDPFRMGRSSRVTRRTIAWWRERRGLLDVTLTPGPNFPRRRESSSARPRHSPPNLAVLATGSLEPGRQRHGQPRRPAGSSAPGPRLGTARPPAGITGSSS